MRERDYVDEETFLEYEELNSVRAAKRMRSTNYQMSGTLDVKNIFEWS